MFVQRRASVADDGRSSDRTDSNHDIGNQCWIDFITLVQVL